MPRPMKGRRVLCMPELRRFGPVETPSGSRTAIGMTVDEFETVRLIDLEGCSQEECALHMGVARTTVQAIYASARTKLAECLVKGHELAIGGGMYTLCGEAPLVPGCSHCLKRSCLFGEAEEFFKEMGIEKKGWDGMRIAVTYENGEVFQHFGHTERFKIYDEQNGEVKLATTVNTNGSGHGALADILKKLQVDTLICGGIGGGAKRALTEAGIKLYGGVTGSADQAVEALLKGTLAYDSDATCDHHGHQHGEDCGEHHHCGEHHQGE